MKIKKNISLLLSLLIAVGATLSLSAFSPIHYHANGQSDIYDNEMYEQNYMNGYPDTLIDALVHDYQHYDVNCTKVQTKRLYELFNGNFIVPFTDDGEPVNVPHVNMFATPEGDMDYFLIGLADEVTEEHINFILSYTGIPRELVEIVQGRFECQIMIVPHGHYDEDIMPYMELVEYIDITPFGTWSVGQMVSIRLPYATLHSTLGHPLSSSGLSFFTATHSHNALNRPVALLANPQTPIGTIRRAYHQPHRDVAMVSLDNPHRISMFVDGGNINNFRASAVRNDLIVSLRGMSGPQRTSVYSSNFRIQVSPFERTNKIALFPDGMSQNGDSGAALIRRMSATDRAVLGTRFGRYTTLDGSRTFGIYTSVIQY
ncbi:MAG: hypothetical protein FWF81_11100 [Defluviitaleaceae bacterium]|nr:hypothetical protein [Defluviitaleaceae bacterium]